MESDLELSHYEIQMFSVNNKKVTHIQRNKKVVLLQRKNKRERERATVPKKDHIMRLLDEYLKELYKDAQRPKRKCGESQETIY